MNYVRVHHEILIESDGGGGRLEFYKTRNGGKAELDRINSGDGQRIKYTEFSIDGVKYFAVEREGAGWNGGYVYEIFDASGFLVQDMSLGGKRINIALAKYSSRKELIQRFKGYVADGWTPHDRYHQETTA